MPPAMYELDLNATTGSIPNVEAPINAGAFSSLPQNVSHAIAPMTLRSQTYYWTRAWQEDEQIALRELREGRGVTCADARTTIRSLLDLDD